MIVQIVMINQETGEPIYDTVLTSADILAAIYNTSLHAVADHMLTALRDYKPRFGPIAAIDAVDDLGDPAFRPGVDLNGPVNMG